jgi:hypothetical protein
MAGVEGAGPSHINDEEDFFKAGLQFPREDFVGEVLQWFDLRIHHLTPNVFSRMSVFAMALKMAGCTLSVNSFARYYETHFRKKPVNDRQTKMEMVAHYGSYNFVPKKTKGTVSIVPAYRNKWPAWNKYWYYHRVRNDEDVEAAIQNGLSRAHVLVSEMTPMKGLRLGEIINEGRVDAEAVEAFAMTARRQIGRDLVEEWLACEGPPLSSGTRFSGIERRDGYVFPCFDIAPKDGDSSYFSFVNMIEHKADEIIGFMSVESIISSAKLCLGNRD